MYSVRRVPPEDISDVLRARYRVYVETDGWLPPNPQHEVGDRYDYLPTSIHIVAEHEGSIVGGLRLTIWSRDGLPAYDYSISTFPSTSRPGIRKLLTVAKYSWHSHIVVPVLGIA
jgi:hypothetical protein